MVFQPDLRHHALLGVASCPLAPFRDVDLAPLFGTWPVDLVEIALHRERPNLHGHTGSPEYPHSPGTGLASNLPGQEPVPPGVSRPTYMV